MLNFCLGFLFFYFLCISVNENADTCAVCWRSTLVMIASSNTIPCCSNSLLPLLAQRLYIFILHPYFVVSFCWLDYFTR